MTNGKKSNHSSSLRAVPLRGPAAVALILAVILGPYLQQWSFRTITQILLLFLACAMMFHDFKQWVIASSRHSLQRIVQKVVLDDVMKAIFHPQRGLLAVSATACLGNFAMYALPTTPEQRLQLWQYALDESLDEAERIWKAPGGIAELLPHSVQLWLSETNSTGSCKNDKQNQDKRRNITPTVENLSPVLSSKTEPESVNITLLSDFHSENDDDDSSSSSVMTSEECNLPRSKVTKSPTTPMEIFGSILGDVATRHLQDLLDRLPPRSLEMTSLTAAALLWAQWRCSKRARDILWTGLHASFSMTGSAVLTGSLLALLMRHQLQNSRQSSPVDSYFSRRSFISLPKSMSHLPTTSHVLKNAMKSLLQSEHARKIQGVLAIAVLAYFGRRRIGLSRSR